MRKRGWTVLCQGAKPEVMKISVFGTGYVGLVTGVCFAEMGNSVICADIDQKKVGLLRDGASPIYEPGLDDLLKENIKQERLSFTTDLKSAVEASEFLFIGVGTPPAADGSADLTAVLSVAKTIGDTMTTSKVVVNKSTVPVGTQKKVKEVIGDRLRARGLKIDFDVVSNPEFLREGVAVEDCLKPARIVIGTESDTAEKQMRKLYDPFLKNGNPLIAMTPESSEMTKYCANAMLAARISIMNEFSRLCEKVGANVEEVRRGIGSDPRIGPQFLFAGVGYGGSCFPKDVQALVQVGAQYQESLDILKSVESTNAFQRSRFLETIRRAVGGSLKGKKIAQWGVAFKPGTDDIREAPAMDLMKAYLGEGAQVMAYDPVAQENALQELKSPATLSFFKNQYDALKEADVLVITTEWKSFREPDFNKMKSTMKAAVICDGRNIYRPSDMKEAGFKYYSVGRAPVI